MDTPPTSSYPSASSVSKRPRTDKVEQDPHNPPPSPVVFLRQLLPGVTENEVVQMLGKLGGIAEVAMMPQKHQALVEFEDVEAARRLVEMSQSGEKICICGQPVFVNFSTSQRITRAPEIEATPGVRAPSKVLIFTVYNTQYPVTIEVIYTICSRHAQVLRIVMLRKQTPLQVMVEFEDVNEARRIKRLLNGADIYSGCCSLKVEHAKPASLTVNRNDLDSWDYTVVNMRSMPAPATMPAPLLSRGPPGPGPMAMMPSGPQAPGFPLGMMPPPGQPDGNPYQSVVAAAAFNQLSGTPGPVPFDSPGSVVFVQHLPVGRFNCDMLFNLCCLYGNVHRVKFLKNREGTAMVQMADAGAAERVIKHLSGCVLFGQRIDMQRSKHPSVTDLGNFLLHDKSQSFKDYMTSKHNRFNSADTMAKNRILAPTATLHFYNCPPTIQDEELAHVFEQLGAPRPSRVVKFQGRSDKSSSGLLEFDSVNAASEALTVANHHQIETAESKYPYTMKLAFSASEMHQRDGTGEFKFPQQAALAVYGQQPSAPASPGAAAVSPIPLASLAQVEFPGAGANLFGAQASYASVASLAGAMPFPAGAVPRLAMAPGPAPTAPPAFPGLAAQRPY